MRFTVGGGVHEHGRNCFFVESDTNYIVDCGIMRGDVRPYPHLSNEQIKSAKYLFLTHMHEDHIGAFTWLVDKGFCGFAVASEETLAALPAYEKKLALPQAFGKVNIGTVGIEYGRSGHCVGSLWYAVTTQSSKLLFSGDYCEHSCFNVDKIEGQSAELAVLDCALGNMPYNRQAQEECTKLGIVIPCWKCCGKAEVNELHTGGKPLYAVACQKHYCGAYGAGSSSIQKAIEFWNTRPAPPIGRCGECEWWDKNTHECWCAADIEIAYHKYTEPDYFCGDFAPKEGEENG